MIRNCFSFILSTFVCVRGESKAASRISQGQIFLSHGFDFSLSHNIYEKNTKKKDEKSACVFFIKFKYLNYMLFFTHIVSCESFQNYWFHMAPITIFSHIKTTTFAILGRSRISVMTLGGGSYSPPCREGKLLDPS